MIVQSPSNNPQKIYTREFIAKTLEHSILRPTHTEKDIRGGAAVCKKYNLRELMVDPDYIKLAKELLSNTDILSGSVCDFPHGRSTTEIRIQSAKLQLKQGSDEIDIVSKYRLLLQGDSNGFKEDLRRVKKEAIGNNVLKIILEVDYLFDETTSDPAKLIREATQLICDLVKEENIKNLIVKTKTGFAPVKIENKDAVKIIKEVLEKNGLYAKTLEEIREGKIAIKASGGNKTKEDVVNCYEAGAHLIGTSSGDKIMES